MLSVKGRDSQAIIKQHGANHYLLLMTVC